MDDSKSLKVRLTFCVLLVGISLLFTAVVTDHWAVLSPKVENYNTTCEAAHFGLWRLCKKQIYVQQQGPKEKGCGPISLPGGTYSPPPMHGMSRQALLRRLQDGAETKYVPYPHGSQSGSGLHTAVFLCWAAGAPCFPPSRCTSALCCLARTSAAVFESSARVQ